MTIEQINTLLELLQEFRATKQQANEVVFYLQRQGVVPQHFHECWVCGKIYNSFTGYCCEGKEHDHV